MHSRYGDVAVTLEDFVATVEILRPPQQRGFTSRSRMTLMCGPGPIGGPTRSHQEPTVWADDLAGDKFSFVGRQKTARPGDFLRPGHALERGLLYHDRRCCSGLLAV